MQEKKRHISIVIDKYLRGSYRWSRYEETLTEYRISRNQCYVYFSVKGIG